LASAHNFISFLGGQIIKGFDGLTRKLNGGTGKPSQSCGKEA